MNDMDEIETAKSDLKELNDRRDELTKEIKDIDAKRKPLMNFLNAYKRYKNPDEVRTPGRKSKSK